MISTVKKLNYEGKLVAYKVTYSNSDVPASVPIDTENTDYQTILEWAAIDGNTIAEAD
jgi:hypothetical protein